MPIVADEIHALTKSTDGVFSAPLGGSAQTDAVVRVAGGAGVQHRQKDISVRSGTDNHMRVSPQQVRRPNWRTELDQLDAIHRNPVIFASGGQYLEERGRQVVQITQFIEGVAVT